jgi:hypothetical protein
MFPNGVMGCPKYLESFRQNTFLSIVVLCLKQLK